MPLAIMNVTAAAAPPTCCRKSRLETPAIIHLPCARKLVCGQPVAELPIARTSETRRLCHKYIGNALQCSVMRGREFDVGGPEGNPRCSPLAWLGRDGWCGRTGQ